jgi:large subunit ribosomal protein L23
MQVLKKPILTEKVAKMQDDGVFAFIVDRKANKYQIKEAVEKTYNVQVATVNTMVMPGKPKSRYTKSGVLAGQTKPYKKALVKLQEGEYIDLYDNV